MTTNRLTAACELVANGGDPFDGLLLFLGQLEDTGRTWVPAADLTDTDPKGDPS